MKKTILAILTLLAGLAAPLPAEIMTYQGRLKDNSLPANGNYSFAFDFCDASQTACYGSTDNPQNFLVANGLFKSTFTMPSVDLAAQAWYLRVSVGGTVLSPIERLTFVPHAVYSSSAGYSPSAVQKSGDVMAGQLTLAGSTLTVTGNEFSVGSSTFVVKNGYVGLGTASPAARLHVVSDNGYVHFAAPASNLIVNMVPQTYGTAILNNNGAGPIALSVANNEILRVSSYSAVGIGTSVPAARLHISSGAGESGNMVLISTGSSDVIRMTGGGEVYASRFIGDGSGITGVTGATGTDATKLPLSGGTMSGNIVMSGNAVYGVSTVTVSGDVTAARYQINGTTVMALLPGAGSFAVGTGAGAVSTGSDGLFVGVNSGANTAGSLGNTFVGSSAGRMNVSGYANTFVGSNSGYSSTGSGNTAAGYYSARYNGTGSANSYFGYQVAYYNQLGSANSVFGYNAGVGASGNSYSSSTIMGYQAGQALTTGSDNTLIGFRAGADLTSGAGNILVGYNASASAPTASSELNIGDLIFGQLGGKTIGISTRAPQAALDVVATGNTNAVSAQIWRDSDGDVISSMSAAGYITAAGFIGDGSGLTGINADLNSPVGTLAVADGGTGATTPAGARANLGALASFGDTMTGPLEIHVGADPAAFRVGVSTFVIMDGKVGVNTSAPVEALEVGAGNLRLPLGQRLEWGAAADSVMGSASGLVVYQANSPRLGISSNGGYTTVGAGDIFSVSLDTNSALHVVSKGLPTGDGRLAVFADLLSNGSAAGQYLAAGNFEATVDGADSAELATALRAKIRRENAGVGVLNNAYGVLIDDLQNQAGTISNTYGLYIGDQTSGTQTNPAYALYSADGSARSYFAGKLGVGIADPLYSLDVFETIRAHNPSGGNGRLILSDGDIAHGMTSLAPTTDTFGLLTANSPAGGLHLAGYSSIGSASALYLAGIIGDPDPVDGVPALVISGAKKNGAVSQPLGALETVLAVNNGGGGSLLTVLGNGDLGVSTGVPQARLDVLSSASDPATMAQIWRNSAGAIVSSVSAAGYLQAVKFVGDGSALTNVAAATGTDATKLPLSGGTLTGPVTLSINNPTPAAPVVLAEDTSATGEPQFEVKSNGYRGRMSIAGTNGGMYFGTLTPNFLSFQTAGAEWMRLTTQGYLGIGTASPQHYLHISSNTSTPSNTLLKLSDTGTGAPQLLLEAGGHQGRMATAASNGGTYIGTLTNDFLVFQTNSAEQMRIAADGKIGTGGILPAEAFDVASRVQISTYAGNVDTDGLYSNGLNGIVFKSGGTSYLRVAYGGGNMGVGASVSSGAGEAKLQVKGSLAVGAGINGHTGDGVVVQGRVGIGTAAPSGMLEVRDITAVNNYLLVLGTGSGNGFFSVSTSGIVGVGYGAPSTQTVLHAQAVATDRTPGSEDVMVGMFGSVRAVGTGLQDAAAGGDFMATIDGSYSIDHLVGLHTSVERENAGAGYVKNAMGLYVDVPRNGGGAGYFENTYGVYIDSQTSGIQANPPYSIYALDQGARSYFGGKVGIGTASPRYALEVSSAPGSSDQILAVSTGTDVVFGVKGNGEVYGAYFIGNGAGLTNISASDASKLPLAGGTLTGPLTINNSSITINSTLGQNFMRLNSDTSFGGIQFASFGSQLGSIGFGNNGGHFIPALSQSMAVQAEYGLHLGVGVMPLITMTPVGKVGIGVILSPKYSLDVSTSNNTDSYVARFGGNGIEVSTGGAIHTTGFGTGATAGNQRASNAVDLQTWRDDATQVASGEYSVIAGGRRNRAYSNYSTVGGGDGNSAGWTATVAGGQYNSAGVSWAAVGGGRLNEANGMFGSIMGGDQNKVQWEFGTVGGGQFNVVSGSDSVIAGGAYNTVTGTSSVVAGGEQNSAPGMYAGVLGGNYNEASGWHSAVAGGIANKTLGGYSFLGSGYHNNIYGGTANVLAGGELNVIMPSAGWAFIGGGKFNEVNNLSNYSSVVGGYQNYIYSNSMYSLIGGGRDNMISTYGVGSSVLGGSANKVFGSSSTIAGGDGNVVISTASFIGGGRGNVTRGENSAIAGGYTNAASEYSAYVGGGYANAASSYYTAVGGGLGNTANGHTAVIAGGNNNTASGTYSTLGGGARNIVQPDGYSAVIGGGYANLSTAPYSTVGGGLSNTSSGTYSGVLSGTRNEAVGVASFIGGGAGNRANGENSTVAGGWSNTASETGTTVAGGVSNTANEPYSFVGGGYQNDAATGYTAIAGGYQNTIGTPGGDGAYSFIGGGYGNETQIDMTAIGGGESNYIANAGRYGVIGGGYYNTIRDTRGAILGGEANLSTAPYATVGGGLSNTSSGTYSAVLGGYGNEAAAIGAAIAGGEKNYAGGLYSFVGGGRKNYAPGNFSAIAGGENNNTDWGQYAAIGGGSNNFAYGFYSAIPGGAENYAGGQYSLAAGHKSSATLAASGSFTWNDNYGDILTNQWANTVMFKASGGFWVSTGTVYTDPAFYVDSQNRVGIGTAAPGFKLHVFSSGGAVAGLSTSGSSTDAAVYGWSNGAATAVKGVASSGYAGRFEGNVFVTDDGVNPASPAKLQVNGDLGLGDGTQTGNAPVVIWLTAAGAAADGDIVVASGGNQFSTTVTGSDYRAIGVAVGATPASTVGKVAVGGVAVVNCSGVTAGQHAVTSTVAGQAVGQNNPTSGTSIGQFLTSCGTPSAGKAYLLVK